MANETNPIIVELQKENTRLQETLINTRLLNVETRVLDHDRRLIPVEEAVTKFNFLLFLTAGGGLLSFINLFVLIYIIAKETIP